MPIRLNDEHCLIWIKDPSISPFENDFNTQKYRKNILVGFAIDSDDALNNPQSFLNRVRRKCFYNSALRQKMVDKIKEYQSNGTHRLYTLNDKITNTIEPFTYDECERWVKNHTINPRTNAIIPIAGTVYIELIYTTIQYGLPTPSILDTVPTDINKKELYKQANKIIENIILRLDFMKQNDEYFLKHDIGSFDRKLKIMSPLTPIRKAAAKAERQAIKPPNTFGISSSSSYQSLNSKERKILRDIELENIEEKKLVAEYQYKKGLLPKKDVDKKFTIFDTFKNFLISLENEIINGNYLINNILEDATDIDKSNLIANINTYLLKKKNNDQENVTNFLKNNKLDTIEGIISNFITNIYVNLMDPSIVLPQYMEIGLFSSRNKLTYFQNNKIIMLITNKLEVFIENYYQKTYKEDNYKIKNYFMNIVIDLIPRKFIDAKIKYYITYPPTPEPENFYYTILITESEKSAYLPVIMRLPVGQGLLIGKELTKAIIDLGDPNFEEVDGDSVLTDDNPLNGFTYEECRNWVILPIINPRTFKRILIDSPIYNRLLCISYQYDTKLIPRMITQRGYDILKAVQNIILNILYEGGEEKQAQSKEELENYIISAEAKFVKEKEENKIVPNTIGLKWKNAGTKHPTGGVEIINKNLKAGFLKSTNQDGGLPFYVSFSEEDLSKFGITDIAKNSYISISTYYIQTIDNKNKTANNTGLRWKILNNERYKDSIKREGFEIINKKLKEAFIKLASKDNILPSRVSFRRENLEKFGITTPVANNRYIKFVNYYVPVFDKSFSDIFINKKSNGVITKRNPDYFVNKYYTVADCLRWANQPNRDPRRQDIFLTTDSEEYNAIFEQAILYDYDIMPINITRKGKKFMKSVIKTKGKLLTIAKYPLKHETSNSIDIAKINTKICNAIKNICDDETVEERKKYKHFKDKMKKKCVQYNKEPSLCIANIKEEIKKKFPPNKKHKKEYTIYYYEDSALASLLLYYEPLKKYIYNEEIRDIFIHDFNKFYVFIYELDDELNERKKYAIDAGGPKREFLTKLFEELFCDKEHLTRPFIRPDIIIDNKNYINPNFTPDENFKKVIEAFKKNHNFNITEFNTEEDYKHIYSVIGKLLCLTVVNEVIGLPQQLSSYILARLINQKNELNYYDILYFYLQEFNTGISYINMISKRDINSIEDSMMSFNDTYIISRIGGAYGANINQNNYIKFILQQAKHAVTKNFISKNDGNINSTKNMKHRYDSLFGGFSNEIRKFLYDKEITIEQLNLLITNEPLTIAILQELASKLEVYIEVKYTSDSFEGDYTGPMMSDAEKKEKEDEIKGYMSNIITQKKESETEEEHIDFCKKLLRFWTGFTYYDDKTKPYKICYKYGVGINFKRLPDSHTCAYTIDFSGFPADTADIIYTPEMKEQFLYDKFKIAVEEQKMELH